MSRAAHQHITRFAEIAFEPDDRGRAESLLSQCAELISADAGTRIFTQGSPCPAIALLLRGRVRVLKQSPGGRQVTLYRVYPGEACVLTTCCILRESAFPAEAIAEEPIQALSVPAATFRSWFATEDPWRSFVIDLFADRLEHVLSLVDSIAFQRTDARLASHLLLHANAESGLVELTHEATAQEIGTAREVVTRILERFSSIGVIRTRRGAVEILDAERLALIADADTPRIR